MHSQPIGSLGTNLSEGRIPLPGRQTVKTLRCWSISQRFRISFLTESNVFERKVSARVAESRAGSTCRVRLERPGEVSCRIYLACILSGNDSGLLPLISAGIRKSRGCREIVSPHEFRIQRGIVDVFAPCVLSICETWISTRITMITI